jgi:hypothetical protein
MLKIAVVLDLCLSIWGAHEIGGVVETHAWELWKWLSANTNFVARFWSNRLLHRDKIDDIIAIRTARAQPGDNKS